jgi:hypothetical protein
MVTVVVMRSDVAYRTQFNAWSPTTDAILLAAFSLHASLSEK